MCETWDEVPPLIVLENVPKIQTRGAELLARARQLLSQYGYVFHEGTHDCARWTASRSTAAGTSSSRASRRAVTAYVYVRAMADSGFSSIQVIALFASKDIDALIPGGRSTSERAGRNGLFPTSSFTWDEELQAPRCPAGKPMRGGQSREGRECPLLARCTTAKNKTRHLKIFAGDELKRAMAQVMAQPAAKSAYGERAAIVEPVFARLRAAGLSRFRRRGLRGARLEFALACVAHNLRLFLGRTGGVSWALVTTRRPGEPWRLSGFCRALIPWRA